MTDEEIEVWTTERIATIQALLRKLADKSPEYFWREIDQAVAQIVIGTAKANDFDWPDDLHLADVVDKHLAYYIKN